MDYVDRDGKACKACFSFEEMMKQSQKFSKKEKVERRKDCPVDKDELGRSTWNLLHTMAAYYPEKPNNQEKKDMNDTIHWISKVTFIQTPDFVTVDWVLCGEFEFHIRKYRFYMD